MTKLKQLMKGPNEIVPFNHEHIRYEQMWSYKFDGFRMASLCGEQNISPNMKPIRNDNVEHFFKDLFDFLRSQRLVVDGELWSPSRGFHEEIKTEGISSILTTHNAVIPPDIGYYIFDMMNEHDWNNGTEKSYAIRYNEYMTTLGFFPHVHLVEHHLIHSSTQAQQAFDHALADGHEGIILRNPRAGYKHGRCTVNQDGMWKFKEFHTEDGVIIHVEQQMKLKDGVERTTNELGHLERRYEQDLYEPAGMVGSLTVRNEDNVYFNIKPGKGYDNNKKRDMWEQYVTHPHSLLGKHVEYKYMPHGTLNRPRIGSLVRFRPDKD